MSNGTNARKARMDLAVPGVLVGSLVVWALIAVLAVKLL
jgi:hypothetical protein